ncbi:ATP-binding protein [Streptomyces sp. S1D4-11]|nr:ATP-binding protein [Streptomyces sp. S1D4-11]QIZ00772.1 ATP-binding protein [Streptomyces sp. S1D4-11]
MQITAPVVTSSTLAAGLHGESLVHVNADLTGLAAPQRTAQEVVRAVLADVDDDEWVDDIVLVADELVGNAQQHCAADGLMAITVDRYLWGLAVQVSDSCLAAAVVRPEPELPGVGSIHGRGLFLVDALASSWDVQPTAHGKIFTAVFVRQSVAGWVMSVSDACPSRVCGPQSVPGARATKR